MSNVAKQACFLLVSILLLTTSFWYYARHKPVFKLDAETLLSTTDTTITHLVWKQFSDTGTITNRLESPLIRHIPKNNTHWIKTPHIIIAQENQSVWEINAQNATAHHGGESITLLQNVRMHQDKSEHNEESTFTTEKIVYFPKTKLAVTSQKIRFQQPGKWVESIGMKANLENKHIQLLSQTRGAYEPGHG